MLLGSIAIISSINLLINTAGMTQQVEKGGFLHNTKGGKREGGGGSFPLLFKRGAKIYVFEWGL